MTTNTEHTDDAPIDGQRRRPPRTFLKAQTADAPIEPDPATQVEEVQDEFAPDEFEDALQEPDDLDDEAAATRPMYAYEAVACQVSLGADDDAFASTLTLTGDDEAGDEVSVWMRLTPTLITRLTQQLTQVYRAQQEAMGLIPSDPLDIDDGQNDDGDEVGEEEREGLLRRASDPLGVRFLRDRPAAVKWLAIAIGSLLVVSLILRTTVFG